MFQDLDVTTVCAGVFRAVIEAIFGREAEEREAAVAHRGVWPQRSAARVGLARDLERRFLQSPTRAYAARLLDEHRTAFVRVILSGDGRRAAMALLQPALEHAVTTDDVLDHRIDDADLLNAERMLKEVRRVAPELENVAAFGERLLAADDGITLSELLERKFRGAPRRRPEVAKRRR